MAFTTTLTDFRNCGDKVVTKGTYTSADGSTGGDIDTGLLMCEFIKLTPNAAAVSASASVVNETLPVAGSAVTIVSIANESGYWEAVGY